MYVCLDDAQIKLSEYRFWYQAVSAKYTTTQIGWGRKKLKRVHMYRESLVQCANKFLIEKTSR
jgi:hypothetical protein